MNGFYHAVLKFPPLTTTLHRKVCKSYKESNSCWRHLTKQKRLFIHRLYMRTKIEGSWSFSTLGPGVLMYHDKSWLECSLSIVPGARKHTPPPRTIWVNTIEKKLLHGVNRDWAERHSFTGYPQAQNLLIPLNTVGSILIYFPFHASENKVQLIYEPIREKVMTSLNA